MGLSTNFLYDRWENCKEALKKSKDNGETYKIQAFYNCDFGLTFISVTITGDEKLYIPLSKELADQYETPSIGGLNFEIISDERLSKSLKYLTISQNYSPELAAAFEVFTATLIERIASETTFEGALEGVSSVIDAYAEFFKKGGKDALTSNEEQGLFGELLTLIDCIKRFGDKAVDSWCGSDKNKHDFIFADNDAIEVKTTRNQTRVNLLISNENQLSFAKGSLLFLKVYVLERNPSGSTIAGLVEEILNEDLRSSAAKEIFKKKLMAAKVMPEEAPNKHHFQRVSTHIYLIDEDFPRITQEAIQRISTRIFEVKYYLSLDGYKEYDGDIYERLTFK